MTHTRPPYYTVRMRKTDHPLYPVWQSMKRRCHTETNSSFKNYGGRGITICRSWLRDFWKFVRDMGDKPSPAHSVGRIDNDGPYEPANCRWETNLQQQRNRRNNIPVTAWGETHALSFWAERSGVRWWTIHKRIVEYGWGAEDAISTPPADTSAKYKVDGIAYSLPQLAEKFGIREKTLRKRLYKSRWTIERALSEPVKTSDPFSQFE